MFVTTDKKCMAQHKYVTNTMCCNKHICVKYIFQCVLDYFACSGFPYLSVRKLPATSWDPILPIHEIEIFKLKYL